MADFGCIRCKRWPSRLGGRHLLFIRYQWRRPGWVEISQCPTPTNQLASFNGCVKCQISLCYLSLLLSSLTLLRLFFANDNSEEDQSTWNSFPTWLDAARIPHTLPPSPNSSTNGPVSCCPWCLQCKLSCYLLMSLSQAKSPIPDRHDHSTLHPKIKTVKHPRLPLPSSTTHHQIESLLPKLSHPISRRQSCSSTFSVSLPLLRLVHVSPSPSFHLSPVLLFPIPTARK